jgi:hypothetical protein
MLRGEVHYSGGEIYCRPHIEKAAGPSQLFFQDWIENDDGFCKGIPLHGSRASRNPAAGSLAVTGASRERRRGETGGHFSGEREYAGSGKRIYIAGGFLKRIPGN